MISLNLFIEILAGVIVVGGAVVGFFVMQKGQNMEIAQLKKDINGIRTVFKEDLECLKSTHKEELDEVNRKQSIATSNQIKTEKEIISINGKLDYIIDAVDKLTK